MDKMWNLMKCLACVVLCLVCASACKDKSLSEIICEPGATKCLDGNRFLCNAFGTGWSLSPCEDTETCVLDATCAEDAEDCAGTCKTVICAPNKRYCASDNISVLQCDETGTANLACGSCAVPPINGLCYDGECVALCPGEQKSYLGCEYYAADLDNAYVAQCQSDGVGGIIACDAAASQFAIVLSNPDADDSGISAFVTITKGPLTGIAYNASNVCSGAPEVHENFVAAHIIPPQGIITAKLPAGAINGTVLGQLGYRIASNIPITAYQFNPLSNEGTNLRYQNYEGGTLSCTADSDCDTDNKYTCLEVSGDNLCAQYNGVFSNDASLLMPTNTAGTHYIVMNRQQTFSSLKGFITILGLEDEAAVVTITTTAPILAGTSIDLPARIVGETFTVELSKYELLNLESNAVGSDFTGTDIKSTKPVIVFSGSEATNAPYTSSCNVETNTCDYGDSECDSTTHTCAPQTTVCDLGMGKCLQMCDSIVGTCELDAGQSCSQDANCFTACTQDSDCAKTCDVGSDCSPSCSSDADCQSFVTCCADHIEQQLFPVSTWGAEYIGVRSYPRGNEKDVWRILASEEDTVVHILPADVADIPVLGKGEWYEFETSEDFFLDSISRCELSTNTCVYDSALSCVCTSEDGDGCTQDGKCSGLTKPISLGQFLAAEHAPNPGHQAGDADIGDPAFILVAPIRQLRNDYVFLAPDKYENDYISVAAPLDVTLTLDGSVVDANNILTLTNEIDDTTWKAWRIPIADGYHTLVCSEPCSLMVHGYDQYVSYGYPGGLNLEN